MTPCWRWLIVIAWLLLSSCASLTKEECQGQAWEQIGYDDGAAGQPLSLLESHQKTCQRHGITVIASQYKTGRDIGIRDFCTYGSGYNHGNDGKVYHGVCSVELEEDFLNGYYRGYAEYRRRQEIMQLSSEISNNASRETYINQVLRDTRRALRNKDLTKEQRLGLEVKEARLRLELRGIADRARELSAQLEALSK